MEAKYFCSLTRNMREATKLAPAPMAAEFTPINSSIFSSIGTVMPLRRIGVRQVFSPTPGVGASWTGDVWLVALALAIAVARRAAFATASAVSSLVAAKPQAPSAMTRTPTPDDSVLTTFSTLASRVMTN